LTTDARSFADSCLGCGTGPDGVETRVRGCPAASAEFSR
jgi:hypothetical protein